MAAEEDRDLLSAVPEGRTAAGLFRFDRSFGLRYTAGVDEAGRGSLAGPLVAAGVLLDLDNLGRSERLALAQLDDSKKKSEEEREELYPAVIRAASLRLGRRAVGAVHRHARAARLQPRRARRVHARRRAGGRESPAWSTASASTTARSRHTAVVDGDARSAAIAAASVIAKVTRDRYMRRIAATHPHWNFDGNVGYSTPEHRDAIREHGISPLHRRSFASIAYTQLALGEEIDEIGLDPTELSEGVADVVDIDSVRPPADEDSDDVEAVAGDS